MPPPRQWPEYADTHRIEAIALIDRSMTAHEGIAEIAIELAGKYPKEKGILKILQINQLGYDKDARAKEELQAARRAEKA